MLGIYLLAVQYNHYISTYVAQHPFHLFDTYTNRTITHPELTQNISNALKTWTKCPLTCTALLGTIENMIYSEFVSENTSVGNQNGSEETGERKWLSRRMEGVKPYVYSAMMKTGGVFIDGDSHDDCDDDCSKFISSLDSSLLQYNASRPKYRVPIPAILSAIRDLIHANRVHVSIPTYMVHEQIELLSQYAILSHRWGDQVDQELCFTDFNDRPVAQSGHGDTKKPQLSKLSRRSKLPKEAEVSPISSDQPSRTSLRPPLEATGKKGLQKLEGFRRLVESNYGCRYLWMDSICIREVDRNQSIHRMFGWYRRAYVCVVYLSTPPTSNSTSNPTGMPSIMGDPWWARGWTLQEFLAPRRMVCCAADWSTLSESRSKLNALRREIFTLNGAAMSSHDRDTQTVYEPGIHQALFLFHNMCYRDTTLPEDRVYSLFSALDIDIPLDYGEGFDRAFYRLQVECLTRTHDRRLLIWNCSSSRSNSSLKSKGSSPYNSMLAADFKMFISVAIYQCRSHRFIADLQYTTPKYILDPSVSFDADGVMCIMLSLHPWPPTTTATTTTTPDSPLSSTSTLVTTSKLYDQQRHKDNFVFASLGTHLFTGDHYGVLLRPVSPPTLPFATKDIKGGDGGFGRDERVTVLYERIQFLRCDVSAIQSTLYKKSEWVYIK